MNTPNYPQLANENESTPSGPAKSSFVIQDGSADWAAESKQREQDEKTINTIRSSLAQPMSTNEQATAFANTLEPTDFDVGNVRIWRKRNDPSVFVRESIIHDGETLDSLERDARNGEILFNNMTKNYDIRVVSMETKREKNSEGNDAIFTIVDAIDGKNLAKIQSLPTEAENELEQLYVSLAHYYGDAWRDDLPYWGDCRSDQFVYGKKHGESGNHLYVVDVDSKFYRKGEDRFSTIDAALGSLCGELIENERKFNPPVRLQHARTELLRVINEILAKEPTLDMIVEARTWLLS